MLGGILANSRLSGQITKTVWVVPGTNLRFYADITISRVNVLPGGGESGLTDLIIGPIGSAPKFAFRIPTVGSNVSAFLPGLILSSGDSVLFGFHQEKTGGGAYETTRSVNVWIIGREIFKSDFFETR